jgi:hypothetical protein
MFMYMGSVEVTNEVKSVIHEGLIYEIAKIICEKFRNDK